MLYEKPLIKSLDNIVVALCDDYPRRQCIIESGEASRRVVMEYKYLNYKIFEGAAVIVGLDRALLYINEIGKKTGYVNSRLFEIISETTYKNKKTCVKRKIAENLSLI